MKKKELFSIFVVDDDSFYRDTIEKCLKKDLGYKIKLKSFPTGEDCLNAVELSAAPPHIVILDYHLSSLNNTAMNGIKILNKLKAINRNVNVIMLSGQEKMEVAINTIKWGAYDYVIKNENALIRLKHLIDMIIYNIKLKQNVKKYEFWNLLSAILFLAFVLVVTVYIRNQFYSN